MEKPKQYGEQLKWKRNYIGNHCQRSQNGPALVAAGSNEKCAEGTFVTIPTGNRFTSKQESGRPTAFWTRPWIGRFELDKDYGPRVPHYRYIPKILWRIQF